MKRLPTLLLALRAFCEMARYDLLFAIGGFDLVRRGLPERKPRPRVSADCRRVIEAVDWAIAFYWKPVLCLQNALVTARLLRLAAIDAEVVIGCRPEPFFSHAWVEVDGRVVNDSPNYRQQLPALARL